MNEADEVIPVNWHLGEAAPIEWLEWLVTVTRYPALLRQRP
jgi:hypothetical protein